MADTNRRVLVVTPDSAWEAEMFRLVLPPLAGYDCEVERGDHGFGATAQVERVHYDLVVVGFPIEQPPLSALLKSIRWKESACHSTPVLLVTDAEHRRQAEEFLNRGVNRVTPIDATEWEMASLLGDLLAVEPRIRSTLLVKLELPLSGKVESVMAQLDNLSASGMLVRGHTSVEMGAPLPFEFALPGHPIPVRGVAEVVRPTTREREGLVGFAARFVRFDGDGGDRLRRFIERESSVSGVSAV